MTEDQKNFAAGTPEGKNTGRNLAGRDESTAGAASLFPEDEAWGVIQEFDSF